MNIKAVITLIAGAFILSACAESNHYPITGMEVGINDQVQFMSAPDIARY